MQVGIGCIVEGYGEEQAVPILIRRIAAQVDPSLYVHVPQPLRTSRSKLVKPGELERAVQLVAFKVKGRCGILTLIDADDDAPEPLKAELLKRAVAARSDIPHVVGIAKYEFEAWFLASATSLRGKHGLPDDIECHPTPENVRGAKEWLNKRMAGRKYEEVVDQPAFTALFDMDMARLPAENGLPRSPSFAQCYSDIERLLLHLRNS